jgi:RHS repeat-associated protein
MVYNTSNSKWGYQYDLKDHLGNTRVSFSADNAAVKPLQYKDYYPFGMEMANWYATDVDATKYLYNGKELQDESGLNWYDYGARFYDPAIGRWHTPDELGEIRFEESPYCYVGNNPVLRVDPDGRIWDTILDAAFTLYDAGEAAYQYATTGAVSTTTKAALAADALAIIIPGVTGAGIGVRMAAHAEDAVRAADKAVDAVKALDKVSDGAKAVGKTEKLQESAKVGQEAHRQIQKELREQGAKTEVNVTLKDGSTVRKDAVRPDGTKVIIKPDTPSGRRSATAREAKMQDNGHKTEKIYYDPKDPKYLPNSPSYIGPQR